MARLSSSLRVRFIILLVALATIPIITVATIVGERSFTDLEQEAITLQRQIAAGVADRIQSVMENRAANLALLDHALLIATMSRDEQKSTIRNLLAAERSFNELAVLDADGRELVSVANDRVIQESELANRADEVAYRTSLAEGTIGYGPVFFDTESREPRSTTAYPLVNLRAGEIDGALLATVSFRPIWNLLAELDVAPGREVFVIDGANRIVAHANPAVVLGNTEYAPAIEDGRSTDRSGQESIVVAESLVLGGQTLTVVVTQPVSLALDSATAGLRSTLTVTAIALAAAVTAAVLLGARIVRPIEEIAESARAVAGGDFDRRAEVANRDEVGELAAAFNNMAAQLGATVANLEQRVAERTADIEEASERQRDLIAQLESSNAEMAAIQEKLEDSLRSKNEFLGSVSHELRTPLASVVGFATELRDHYVDFDVPEQLELIGMIAAQAQDMADIINDLLVAARAEAGALFVDNLPVDLSAEIETVLGQIPQATVAVHPIDGPTTVMADPVRVRQVLRNLVVNALRYGGEEIEIDVTATGEAVILHVRDNGDGIPQQDWEIIFDPYRRAHDRRGQPASVGLGLTVSRLLANKMKGDLSYRYTEGISVFELTLPSGV